MNESIRIPWRVWSTHKHNIDSSNPSAEEKERKIQRQEPPAALEWKYIIYLIKFSLAHWLRLDWTRSESVKTGSQFSLGFRGDQTEIQVVPSCQIVLWWLLISIQIYALIESPQRIIVQVEFSVNFNTVLRILWVGEGGGEGRQKMRVINSCKKYIPRRNRPRVMKE